MFYRIIVDLSFDNPGAYTGLLSHALGIIDQAHTINPNKDNEEKGFIIIQECHHDEHPPLPCQIIEEHYTE